MIFEIPKSKLNVIMDSKDTPGIIILPHVSSVSDIKELNNSIYSFTIHLNGTFYCRFTGDRKPVVKARRSLLYDLNKLYGIEMPETYWEYDWDKEENDSQS